MSRKSNLGVTRPKNPDAKRESPERKISEIRGDEFKGIDTEHFREAIDCIKKRHRLLFITGGAGTGKSTLVRYIQYYFAHKEPNLITIATVAPTGIAAMSAHGETIHSFFKFPMQPPDSFMDKIKPRKDGLIEKLDVLIIDEISMVRADMFDAIDKALRINRNTSEPFGGVRLVLVGDLLQLPPIVKKEERGAFCTGGPYSTKLFTGARYFQDAELECVEEIPLRKVFRQENTEFAELLNDVRTGKNLKNSLPILNKRHLQPPLNQKAITLVTTNSRADDINSEQLHKLEGISRTYTGKIHQEPENPEPQNKELPVDPKLKLKVGAQIMIVKNDTHQRRWVNGTLAKITKMLDNSVEVETDEGDKWQIHKTKWEKYRLAYDSEKKRIVCEIAWTYEQIPVKHGWAATIHKCQGITLDRVIVDMDGGAFDTGQTYVALSRCRSLDGLYLKNKLREADIRVDQDALRYYTQHRDE